jgi:hypothetical protein
VKLRATGIYDDAAYVKMASWPGNFLVLEMGFQHVIRENLTDWK